MGVIEGNNTIEGALGPLRNAGAPVAGTDAIQTLTFGGTPTGGTFTLTLEGHTTAPITWSATNTTLVANIDAALEALPNVGSGGVATTVGTMTAGIGTITVAFNGSRGKSVVPAMTATSSLTGTSPTLTAAITTPGVAATGRGASVGQPLIDTTNAVMYQNTGTPLAPTWTKVSAE